MYNKVSIKILAVCALLFSLQGCEFVQPLEPLGEYGSVSIEGKVVDTENNPIKGIEVILDSPDKFKDILNKINGNTANVATTNEAGVFRFELPMLEVYYGPAALTARSPQTPPTTTPPTEFIRYGSMTITIEIEDGEYTDGDGDLYIGKVRKQLSFILSPEPAD